MAQKKGQPFRASRAAEIEFSRALKKVAQASAHIVDAHVEGAALKKTPGMQKALKAYSELIDPWARRQAAKMLEKVSKSNRTAYQRAANLRASEKNAKQIGKLLKERVAERDVGNVAAALMNEHVELIKSIPIEAGLRAQKLSIQAVYEGKRADEIAKELARTDEVSESRALLIARTEVARANASITEARAKAIGARGYYWRTTMDGAERHSHAEMNGKLVSYSENGGRGPVLSDGTQGHAGTFPNCRCWQDVQFDDAV